MVNLHPTIYVGTFVHCRNERELEIVDPGVIGVDQHGKIAFVERVGGEGAAADRGRRDTGPRDVASIAKEHGWDDAPIVSASTSLTQFFFPGFIGTARSPLYPCSPGGFPRLQDPGGLAVLSTAADITS